MIFKPKKLLLIVGPCSLENEAVCRAVCKVLVKLGKKHPELNIVFKGSFDKANRTSASGPRGKRPRSPANKGRRSGGASSV